MSEIQTGQLSAAKKYQCLQQARKNVANKKFWSQNTQGFGFIPVTPFAYKISDNSVNSPRMHSLQAQKVLKNHNKPNYFGAQIPNLSKLNPDVWFEKLQNYWDWPIPYFIKFGFPFDVQNSPQLQHDLENHPSAT